MASVYLCSANSWSAANLEDDQMGLHADLYKPYFKKNASSKELLLVSRLAIAFFGLVMACVSVIFYKVCDPTECQGTVGR